MKLATSCVFLALLATPLLPARAWAAAQASNSSSMPSEVCAGLGTSGARVVVGRTDAEKVTLVFGDRGGTCDGRHVYHDGLSGLSIYGPDYSSQTGSGEHENVFGSEDCPGLTAQTAGRRPSEARRIGVFRGPPPPAVQAGPFTITDFGGYFDLQSAAGRHEAASWISKTLAAVRPCWEWRDDDPNPLLQRLYGDLGMRAPSRILSPEALARQVEDRQLRVAIGGQPPHQPQSPQMLANGQEGLALESVTVDRVDRADNGPQANISLVIKVRNVGDVPIGAVWAHRDLKSFLDFGDQPLAQQEKNACDELGALRGNQNLAERVILPNESRVIRFDEPDKFIFIGDPRNEAYGDSEADFLEIVGCLKYAQDNQSQPAALNFAYVVGKNVKGNLGRIGRTDGLLDAKSLKVFSLNRDYK